MSRIRPVLLLLTAYTLMLVGLTVFMAGYFRGRPKLSLPSDDTGDVEYDNPTSPPPPFDRVVFMIVDALRSDFVYSTPSGFNFTQSLIRSGAALPFTALAALPTLTVSRLKALTQGTSQSFLDAFVNVANSPDVIRLEGEDTWLSRLKAARASKDAIGKNLVYYGVDMWLDLYPDIFDRYEGFFGFYMPDVLTLDANITKRLPDELHRDDWAALVLHYEGLDSLAHQGGIKSAHMLSKQAEMDDVVRLIYSAMESEPHLHNTLLLLMGDHGMTEQGNHGGDTPGELAAAMTFISPRLQSLGPGQESPLAATANYQYYSVIDQVDIVPTLAGLLGFSIPAENVGVFIHELLGMFDRADDGLRAALRNAKQMMRLLRELIGSSSFLNATACDGDCVTCHGRRAHVCLWDKVKHLEQEWQATFSGVSRMSLTHAVSDFCSAAKKTLSVPPKNLHLPFLLAGIACTVAAGGLVLHGRSSILKQQKIWVVAASYFLVMFSTSLVKEEQLYWYTASIAWTVYLALRRTARRGSLLAGTAWPVALHVSSQLLNHNSARYSAGAYIDGLFYDYPVLLWTLSGATYIFTAKSLASGLDFGPFLSSLVSWVLCILAVVYKVGSTHRHNPELFGFVPAWAKGAAKDINYEYALWTLWAGLTACLVHILVRHRVSGRANPAGTLIGVVELTKLYLKSQTRPKNLLLLQIFEYQLQWLLSSLNFSDMDEVSVTILLQAQNAYYASGRGNSFASLDFVNGFNGLDGSSVVAVTLQTLLSNWIGPAWWSLAGLRLILERGKSRQISKPSLGDGGNGAAAMVEYNGKGEARRNGHLVLTADAPTPTAGGSGVAGAWSEHIARQTLFTVCSSLGIMLSCLWMQDDGALWTVLAPKYVMASLWASFHHTLVDGVLCTSLWVAIVL